MDSKPKVSIIIPVYKREEYLSECFNSALGQTLDSIEIIIVDKGEKDDARDLIDIFAKKDNRVIAPHIKNNGYGASCNIGFQIARGEYIFILESDDYILPNTIQEMYEYAISLNADIVKTPYMEFFCDGRKQDCPHRSIMANRLPRNTCFSVKEHGELLEIHASLWSCLYKKEYLDKNNIKFIEAPGAGYVDVGFRIDSLVQTNKIAWLDKPFYHYRVDSFGSSTNTFDVSVMIKRWKEVHEKFAEQEVEVEGIDNDLDNNPHEHNETKDEITLEDKIPNTDLTWEELASKLGYRGSDRLEKTVKKFEQECEENPNKENQEIIEDMEEEINEEYRGTLSR